jgi:hypothetical protein
VKIALKGKRFQDVEHIKKNVTTVMNAVPLEASVDCYQNIKYIQVGGDYFEQK